MLPLAISHYCSPWRMKPGQGHLPDSHVQIKKGGKRKSMSSIGRNPFFTFPLIIFMALWVPCLPIALFHALFLHSCVPYLSLSFYVQQVLFIRIYLSSPGRQRIDFMSIWCLNLPAVRSHWPGSALIIKNLSSPTHYHRQITQVWRNEVQVDVGESGQTYAW